LLRFPSILSGQLSVADDNGAPLCTNSFTLPPPTVQALTLTELVPGPANTSCLYAITSPPLIASGPDDPSASLTLTGVLNNGVVVTESFAVLPELVDPSLGLPAGTVGARLMAGGGARIAASATAFINQPAYLVSGTSIPLTVDVPLAVPLGQQIARGFASVQVSRAVVFDPNELVADPNTGATSPEPPSNTVMFVAPQRLTPPVPPSAPQVVPTHTVTHVYYAPADAIGAASYSLPFDASASAPAVSGYNLDRAALTALFEADASRRITAGLLDPNPSVTEYADLETWIQALPAWLDAYNQGPGAGATPLDSTSVLTDPAGRRAFIEHFYGGLLDGELRALADVPGNANAFAQLNGDLVEPKAAQLVDSVNGFGFERYVYALRSQNSAGTSSSRTPSAGPIYTRTVRPPLPPVLFKVTVQPSTEAFIVGWALTGDPDIAGYLVYRADDPASLDDLRWFGADASHPSDPNTLAVPQVNPGQFLPLSLSPGTGDSRLIGLVNDPRLFARDYQGSNMGEVPLPSGPPPDDVIGVYRLADFDVGAAGGQPGAFNYWSPPPTGRISQLVSDSPTSSRIVGLRLGLGRGVPVVVVATYGAARRTMGLVPVQRIAFIDGAMPPPAAGPPPAPIAIDPNATSTWSPVAVGQAPTYAVVAVDIAGNQSTRSATVTVPALVTS
jgi:hypothetical protein